ncbi:GGDEF domain-containing protein [Streptomyces pini]|uniref:Diguanylate cyclase (GGDEF) domain-containing protein n=1 Tax=Streptomyces pini TaxID=1520580 RepID=A0A1I3Z5F2_9ACTN|nr:GGDEF domain-containing protein [Streptomyces pini]SFK39217.1 diguanylate cyclase (GGDEF) domain-containing protein [Streptomyces pini]
MSTAPRTTEEHAPSPSCCPGGGHRPLTDDLTGLLVRRAWEIRASQALASARRQHRPLALLLGDLDRFKAVNDTYGHLAGDAVLRAAADVLRRVGSAVQSSAGEAVCGRYGGHAGDEFLALLPGAGAEEAMAAARLVQQGVREMSVPAPVSRGTTVTITGQTVSLGVAVWDPADPAPGGLSDLLLDSDVALREVKRTGGGRIRLAGAPGAPDPRSAPLLPGPFQAIPPAARPSWLPYGGTHRAVPAGTWWDAVRMPGRTGLLVLDALLRHGDRPPGPVIADLPGETGPGGAAEGGRERSRMYFLIPPRVAERWELPGTRVLGRGSYVVVPDAASVRPPGLHWIVPPAADRRLTSIRALRAALETAKAVEAAEVAEAAEATGGTAPASCA